MTSVQTYQVCILIVLLVLHEGEKGKIFTITGTNNPESTKKYDAYSSIVDFAQIIASQGFFYHYVIWDKYSSVATRQGIFWLSRVWGSPDAPPVRRLNVAPVAPLHSTASHPLSPFQDNQELTSRNGRRMSELKYSIILNT